jgi:hypothetical protein
MHKTVEIFHFLFWFEYFYVDFQMHTKNKKVAKNIKKYLERV